ncbi:hypothetical protein F2Q70_00002276 [Brassica cretica]|uniref:Uncharacterized protein n=1 Tax=Brassica cretica TaxID=69181 RepID=A0A8S9IYN2_BRACR|nr:hypothetical protein F2Q70_00002276 [Brassica cretica]
MERDLAPIVEVLEEINQNTSDHDPSLPSGGRTSRNVSRRRKASLFRRFLAFFCCSATTMSMSRRCSIQIVDSESSSPPSDGSSPTTQVGLISVISLSDELYLSLSGETISEQDGRRIQNPGSKGSDSIQADDSTPQSYVLADECETILEQETSNLHYPDSEGSDFMQSEDSTPQRYVLANECETILEQDRRSIQTPPSEGSDSMQSGDLTSQGYVTADESLSEIVSEQDRGNTPSPASEESDSIESEDSTSHGYVTADELTEVNTISEHDRRSMPSPASEKSDCTQYEDSTSETSVTANELSQDTFPQSLCFPQSPSSRPSIESTFPSCRTPTRLSNVSFNI